MVRLLNKLLNGSTMFPIQNKQYAEKIPMSGTVAAGSGGTTYRSNVSNLGHFLCLYVTGSYETMALTATTHTVDDGICHLSGQLIDGAGQRLLFSDFVPFDLFLSPGRRRSADAENNLLDVAVVANQAENAPSLFYPLDLEYLFTANSDIQMIVKNDSDVALDFDIVFHGVRIVTGR